MVDQTSGLTRHQHLTLAIGRIVVLLWIGVTQAASEPASGIRFEEVAGAMGVDHFTIYGAADQNRYLVETTGTGVAIFDYDNDGWLDLFFVNGSRFQEHPAAPSRLYRNQQGKAFQDVTTEAGLEVTGWGQAVCAGDYDNDGWEDLLVTFWGSNRLYRNRGNGTFSEVAAEVGLGQERRRWNSGCAFLDYDKDGDLDLFVGNYIDFDPENTPTPDSGLCLYKGIAVACGPPGLAGGKNLLYRNSSGRFEDVSESSGIRTTNGTYSLGVLTADFNNDGWMDIYVANDSNPSALYQNNRDGTFTDIGVLAGCAYSQDGKPQAGMGVDAADYDGDGRLDIFKTNFAEDSANLYRNLGQDFFEEKAFTAGIGINTRFLGWGCGLFDFDNDGWPDIFQVNGHVYPEIDLLKSPVGYRQPKVVYRNLANGRFQDITAEAGKALLVPQAGRGAAFGDLDNDGDIDVAVNNVNEKASVYRNDSGSRNHWVALRLLGSESNRSALGARVICRAGGRTQIAEVRSGGSYYSQNQLRVHFGLGEAKKIDSVEILWPSGKRELLNDVPLDRLLYVQEGAGWRLNRELQATPADSAGQARPK